MLRLLLLAKRSEGDAQLGGEKLWLFPGRKVAAFLHLIEMDEFGKCLLGPAPRGGVEFVRKDAHGNRDGDAFGVEIPEFAPSLPIETGARERCVRQPGDRDVVEDVVARQALRLSVTDASDKLIAA